MELNEFRFQITANNKKKSTCRLSSTVGFFSFFPPILSAPPFIFIFLNRLKNTRRRRRVFGVKSTQPAELSYHSLFALKPVALLFVVFFSCVSDGNSSLLLLSFFFFSLLMIGWGTQDALNTEKSKSQNNDGLAFRVQVEKQSRRQRGPAKLLPRSEYNRPVIFDGS